MAFMERAAPLIRLYTRRATTVIIATCMNLDLTAGIIFSRECVLQFYIIINVIIT